MAISANAPFLLDELTPAGAKLFVALGWPDDEKSHGYAAAKDKVAKRVPAQDWSFIESGKPEGFPEKSQETPSQGGRPKQDGPETYPEKSRGKWGGSKNDSRRN